MRYKDIPKHEENFFKNGNANGVEFFVGSLTVANPKTLESVTLRPIRKKDGDESFYYKQSIPKKRIMLHFTMGYLQGDIQTLTQKGVEVSVPFIVSRSGEILHLFQSQFWSYHVGKAALGGNKTISSTSLGIEISNIGPLKVQGNKLFTEYGSEYCSLSDEEAYTKLGQPYRGSIYYASYPDAQIESVAKLIRLLLAKNNIPKNWLPESTRYLKMTDAKQAQNFSGILSHVNVRSDKKDIGPAFPWNKLIQLV